MKKVLVVAHLLRASPRIPGMAKYLPEFGWQPIVLTAPVTEKHAEPFAIIETGYRPTLGFWKKVFGLNPDEDERAQLQQRWGAKSQNRLLDFVLTRAGEVFNYPDSDKGWKNFALKIGREVIDNERIDAIISSSSPVTAHIIASQLKTRHQIPWVADLRDLWSQNHNYTYSRMRRWRDTRLEVKTLSMADALVTVSQPWADKLGTLHKDKPVHVITNGFDPQMVNSPPSKLTAKFTITYTGMIYPGKQDVTRLFAALRDLITDRTLDPKDIEIRFFGAREDWLDKEIERFGLSNVAHQLGQVSRDDAIKKQWESQLLLLLNWDDPKEKGTYPGKVFEYLAARRPILSTGGSADDVIASLLRETGAGIHALTVDDTKNALTDFYTEYKSKSKLSTHGDEAKIQKYSYREMARKFASILNELTHG